MRIGIGFGIEETWGRVLLGPQTSYRVSPGLSILISTGRTKCFPSRASSSIPWGYTCDGLCVDLAHYNCLTQLQRMKGMSLMILLPDLPHCLLCVKAHCHYWQLKLQGQTGAMPSSFDRMTFLLVSAEQLQPNVSVLLHGAWPITGPCILRTLAVRVLGTVYTCRDLTSTWQRGEGARARLAFSWRQTVRPPEPSPLFNHDFS